jgi:hypothetical protein
MLERIYLLLDELGEVGVLTGDFSAAPRIHPHQSDDDPAG